MKHPVGMATLLVGLALPAVRGGVAQTGTISGTVRIAGAVPVTRWLKVTKNNDVCGDSIRARDVVIKDQRLADAVIAVEGLSGKVEPKEYLLSNTACMFDPPILAVGVGSGLTVDNRDDVLHNTHLNLRYGERVRTVGNWGLSQKGMTVRSDRVFRQPGIIDVQCDAHPWMSSMIVGFAHPYFTTTDPAGSFTIPGVPAGTHRVRLVHPVYGQMEQAVTVPAGGTVSVSFSIVPPRAAAGAAP